MGFLGHFAVFRTFGTLFLVGTMNMYIPRCDQLPNVISSPMSQRGSQTPGQRPRRLPHTQRLTLSVLRGSPCQVVRGHVQHQPIRIIIITRNINNSNNQTNDSYDCANRAQSRHSLFPYTAHCPATASSPSTMGSINVSQEEILAQFDHLVSEGKMKYDYDFVTENHKIDGIDVRSDQ